MLSMIEQLSPRQQISALMNGILEFAEVKANKDLKEKITRKRLHLEFWPIIYISLKSSFTVTNTT